MNSPHEVRRAPAEVVVVVVAQGPDRLQVSDVLDEVLAERLRRGAEHVGLGVLEAEDEVDVRLVDQGLEGPGDVLGPGLVLAVDQRDLASGLGRGRVQDALAVGVKGPCLLLGGGHVGHVLARGQADAGQVRVRQEHLLDALAEVVRGRRIVELVRQSVLALRTCMPSSPLTKMFQVTT